MKLRIRGSSIRLRLTKPEIDALRSNGTVEDAAEFPNARLRYAIVADCADGARLGVSFDASGIVVRVPRERAEAWCTSDEVGIAGEDGPTRILLEKDWACVQPRSEEEENPAEMFANPRGK